jgi:hypothetical protein
MEVRFTAETEQKVRELAALTGQATDELLEDVVKGYFDGVRQIRETLDSRYDELKRGTIQPIDGEKFFENLRRREDDLLKKNNSPQ